MRINDLITYGANKPPDAYHQKQWLGYVRFQGQIVRVSKNYGIFLTANSVDSLPENLKSNLRVCCIIEPDFKRVIVALLTCNGLIQGFTNAEEIAYKLIEFLNQLPVIVTNIMNKNYLN